MVSNAHVHQLTVSLILVCEGLSKISINFTLHLIKVGKLKLFKKVSSDLKTISGTNLADLQLLAVSRALRKGKGKHVNQS